MAAAAREYFTVDLRGLRAALAARATRHGVTESDVLRIALAAALGTSRGVLSDPASDSTSRSMSRVVFISSSDTDFCTN